MKSEKISDLMKEALKASGFTEKEMATYLELKGRSMVAQYKSGDFDENEGARLKKHIHKLRKLISESNEVAAALNPGNINEIIAEQNKRIGRLESDIDLLKKLFMDFKKTNSS